MTWNSPLLELSVASLVKEPRLCVPEQLAPMPPHIKDKILRSLSKRYLSPELLSVLIHKHVKEVDLQDLAITDGHLKALLKQKNYRKLNLNQVKKPNFKQDKENSAPLPSQALLCQVVTGCHRLHTLFLAGWSGLTVSTLTTLTDNCPQLRCLDLGHCPQLDDGMLAAVSSQLAHLESLSLTGTGITDLGLAGLGASESRLTLKELRINRCVHITDDGIEMMLEGLEALEILIFNGCPKVTDDSRVALDRYLQEHRVNVRQLSWTVY